LLCDDRPPLPWEGDVNPDLTYAGVGRVTSAWEKVELQLRFLHSALLGKYQDFDALTDYGTKSAFRGRFEHMQEAGRRFFCRFPDQMFEADFDAFCAKISAFADRRHDVAHGIFRDQEWASWRIPGKPDPFSQGTRYFLLPSHYKAKNFGENLSPAYAYTSPTLQTLASRLEQLSVEVDGFGLGTARYAVSGRRESGRESRT
jgi:hypothetical protein